MKKEIKIAYFPSDTSKDTVLTSNGTVLDNYCTNCESEENIENGNYTLDATFTLDAVNYLNCEDILKVKMDYGDEIFKISKVTIGTKYIDIVARQITIPATLCLYLDNVRPINKSGQSALNHLLTNAIGNEEITLVSDIETISTAYYMDMSLYKALHDNDNSFINRWGGEILRRGYTLSILTKVGIDRGVSIREGKNLTGFNGLSNLDNLITKARGKGFDGIKGNWIGSPLIDNYSSVYQQTIEFSDVKVKGDSDTDGYDTLAQAQAELDRRVALEFSENDIDKIKATYEINFVQLEKTEEYKNYVSAERTYIGDTIRVYVPKVKCDVKVRAVIKRYDVLSQKTKEIKLSNAVNAEALSINTIISDIKKQYNGTNNNNISSYIDSIIKSGMKDSFVVIRENELLAMDSKDINTATNVVRINKNGIAFSQTGYYGTYTNGFSIDGHINATLVDVGILSAIYIQSKDGTSYWDLNTGVINLNKGKILGNALSIDLDTGVVNFNKGMIKGQSLSLDLDTGIVNFNKGIIKGPNSYWNLDTGVAEFKNGGSIVSSNGVTEMDLNSGAMNLANNFSVDSAGNVRAGGGNFAVDSDGDVTINGTIICKDASNRWTKIEDGKISFSSGGTIENSTYEGKNTLEIDAGVNNDLTLWASTILAFGDVITSGNIGCSGDLTVTGNKNCVQKTDNYGDRLFYSIEDTDSYLTYRTSTAITTGSNTEIKIDIDNIYKECVNTAIDYIVEINKVSFGDYRIKEQTSDYFIIESDRDNFEFKYTIVAKRKGYEDRHIDEYKRKAV